MTLENPGPEHGIQSDVERDPPGTDDPVGDAGSASDTQRSSWPWKKVALAVGGAAVTVAGTVVATLAATHKSAVSENAAAYANGISDALKAVRNGFDPFDS